jgi:hypothetical protein
MKLLRKIPLGPLAVLALLLAIVPFGQPHLIQKLDMLFRGALVAPIDWLDLMMHGLPLLLFLVRLIAEIPLWMAQSSPRTSAGPSKSPRKGRRG